jgi:hypothetical protein
MVHLSERFDARFSGFTDQQRDVVRQYLKFMLANPGSLEVRDIVERALADWPEI